MDIIFKKFRLRGLYVLTLSEFLIALSGGFIGPIAAIYFERISQALHLVPILMGLYWITIGILMPFFGKYVDKVGKKRGYLIGCILTSIAIFIYPIASNVMVLLIAQIISAIGFSFHVPSLFSLLTELTSKRKRGYEIGRYEGTMNIAYGISALLSATILLHFSIKTLFYIAGVFYLVAGLIIFRMIKKDI